MRCAAAMDATAPCPLLTLLAHFHTLSAAKGAARCPVKEAPALAARQFTRAEDKTVVVVAARVRELACTRCWGCPFDGCRGTAGDPLRLIRSPTCETSVLGPACALCFFPPVVSADLTKTARDGIRPSMHTLVDRLLVVGGCSGTGLSNLSCPVEPPARDVGI